MSIFKNEEFRKEVKELLKTQGKEDLLDFLEENVETSWEVIKIATKHSVNKIDDMVVMAMDSQVKELIDKIDGKEG